MKQAEFRRIIKKYKSDYWRKYCESLGKNTPLDRVWCAIKKMSGNSKDYYFPAMIHNKNIIIDK